MESQIEMDKYMTYALSHNRYTSSSFVVNLTDALREKCINLLLNGNAFTYKESNLPVITQSEPVFTIKTIF